MSSEPPPRILPKGLSHETKSAQEDVASSRKVEKVRAVDATDADERARQRDKFRRMMGDEETSVDESAPKAPSPFDVFSGAAEKGNPNASVFSSPAPSQSATPSASYGDIDDAIIASPAYTPPPDLTAPPPPSDDDEEDATTGALPQSEDFWEDVDLPPDRTVPTQTMEESPKSAAKSFPGKKGAGAAETGKKEASPFGLPGKPVMEGKGSTGKKEAKEKAKPKGAEKKSLPSPFEQAAQKVPPLSQKPTPEKEGVATTRYFAPEEMAQREAKKSPVKEKAKASNLAARESDALPFRLAKEEQSGGGGASKDQGRKIVEIEAPSLSLLPASVQPGAFAATSAATPYLHPSTVSLFFQMVGTMYVMTAPPGISRTEIVLNNPAYAGSRFYGSTITIEKYATAPDSFNIRLTGNDDAVTTFRNNIPSLMEGFQTSNLPFRVHRIDAEYTIERPVFRRKERGEEKGETGSGDLGERRK